MGELIFLTGPVRSGKSRRAVETAMRFGESVAFVATYKPDITDDEMTSRIERHQAERPRAWRTLEAPDNVAAALHRLIPAPSCALIDSLVTWLAVKTGFAGAPALDDEAILATWDRELAAFREAPWPVIVIGDEVGWSSGSDGT